MLAWILLILLPQVSFCLHCNNERVYFRNVYCFCLPIDSFSLQILISVFNNQCTGLADYTELENIINIPSGASVGNRFCKDITLFSDNTVEEAEETFSISLTSSGTAFVEVPDTTLTVTIMDADGKL